MLIYALRINIIAASIQYYSLSPVNTLIYTHHTYYL